MERKPIEDQPLVTLTSVIENKSSQTLLEFLCKRFKYLTQDEWRARILDGSVKVNDHAASEGQPLRAGDVVAYTTSSWEEPAVDPNYRILHEDEALVVLSKPSPLPVHAIGAYFQNTLMTLLRRDRPEARGWHPVHRLDSETSGLLVLAKEAKWMTALQKQWTPSKKSEGSVQKIYRAIVFGKFPEGKRLFEGAIGPKKGSSVRMKTAVVNASEEGAKPSSTEFTLLETKGNFSLVECRPLTGRTHQIRVHLEHQGFPIVGDKIYSGNDETFLHFYENDWDEWLKERVLLPRVALHAFRLEFIHPTTGKPVVFQDPLPEDLERFWGSLP